MTAWTERLGISIASADQGSGRFERAARLVREAEDAGFECAWTSELYNRSATIQIANFALASSTVRIGSNIAYGVGRSPLMWAAEARDLDELSGGRLWLGLGNGTARMMEDWHGVDGSAPAARMAELVEVLRKLWALHEGPVHHDGRFYRVHVVPTAETPPPVQARLPILVAGVNARMVAVAGAQGDGLVGHPMYTGRYVREVVRPQLATAARDAGRDPAEVAVTGILMCNVTDDVATGRRQLAYALAQYAASKVYDRLFELHGWTDIQLRIRTAAKARDVEAMAAAVPDEVLDAVGVVCRPGELLEHVEPHAQDYDHLALVGMPWGLDPASADAENRRLMQEVAAGL